METIKETKMKKVYCVMECYQFDGAGADVTVCDTFEKAKEIFEKKVFFEMNSSWIDDYSDVEKGDEYFHAYDPNDYYETTIWIVEKEIVE